MANKVANLDNSTQNAQEHVAVPVADSRDEGRPMCSYIHEHGCMSLYIQYYYS